MIDVAYDREGMRIAMEEILEEDYLRAFLAREIEGAAEETRERIEARLPRRTLSPGYYTFAEHLFRLESEQKAGISLDVQSMAAFEAGGLLVLANARAAFSSRHPECTHCGARLSNRFATSCHACGTKFRKKG